MMNPFAPRTYGSLQRVTDRVYIFRNIVNSAVVLGDDAIAVIDTQVNDAAAARLVQAVQACAPQWAALKRDCALRVFQKSFPRAATRSPLREEFPHRSAI